MVTLLVLIWLVVAVLCLYPFLLKPSEEEVVSKRKKKAESYEAIKL